MKDADGDGMVRGEIAVLEVMIMFHRVGYKNGKQHDFGIGIIEKDDGMIGWLCRRLGSTLR